MHYKNGRQNHDFQIAFFLVGACHTADAAYALLKDQFEDRDNAIKMYAASKLKEKAKQVRANATILRHKDRVTSHSEGDGSYAEAYAATLEAQAELAEIEAMRETTERNLKAAEDERAFLQDCIDKLQPYRKFAHLSDAEAGQAAQREEWRLELMQRASNFLLTSGSIPHDHFNTMRMHPDFERAILPHLTNVHQALQSGRRDEAMRIALDPKIDHVDVKEVLQLNLEPCDEVPLVTTSIRSLGLGANGTGSLDFSQKKA